MKFIFKKLSIASDHAGFKLKEKIKKNLKKKKITVVDLGPKTDDSVDYPDFAETVAKSVASGEAEFGLLVCGSGIGVCMVANKISGIRAATIHDVTSAHLSREHNDANIICLGERLIGPEVAKEALDVFLASEFQEGRHLNRVKKIDKIL